MSHQKKIEQVLDLLINEEHEAASDLLHSVIVEKARDLYEELVDEDFGGDETEDFAADIEADSEEVDADEFGGEEVEGDDADDAPEEEEEIEDRVEDLETEFAQLQAEFAALVGDEAGEEELPFDDAGEEGFGDEGGFEGGEEELEVESMYEEEVDDLDEATKLSDEVKGKVLDGEGKLSGTGKNSSAGATNTKAPFSKAPSKKDHGGKAHKIGGSDESGSKASQGKEDTPTSNIDVKQGKQSAKTEAGDDSSADSVLGTKGNPKGA